MFGLRHAMSMACSTILALTASLVGQVGGMVVRCARWMGAMFAPRAVRGLASAAAAVVLVVVGKGVALATDPLIPDTGVDVAAFLLETITTLGAIVAVVVGAYFAFLLIRKAMRWARSAF